MALSGRIRQGIALFNKPGHPSSDSLSTQESTLPRFLIAHANSLASRNYATSTGTKEQKIKDCFSCVNLCGNEICASGFVCGSGNYASTLYIAAVKANVLEKFESEIGDLIEATKRSPKFLEFTKDLFVPKDSRVKAMQAICDDSKFSDITRNFLGMPLPPQEEQALKETLQAIIGARKKVHLEQKIDPSILGDLVVEFNQKVLDMSIKTRALQMERFLGEPINFGDI